MEQGTATLEIAETIELPVSLRKLGRLALGDGDALASQVAPMHGGFPGGAPDPRTLAPGATVRHAVIFMGMPTEVTWTIARWEPFQTIALTGAGPLGAQLSFEGSLELIDGGVRASYRLSIGGAALVSMLPAIEPQLRASIAQTRDQLRRLLAD